MCAASATVSRGLVPPGTLERGPPPTWLKTMNGGSPFTWHRLEGGRLHARNSSLQRYCHCTRGMQVHAQRRKWDRLPMTLLPKGSLRWASRPSTGPRSVATACGAGGENRTWWAFKQARLSLRACQYHVLSCGSHQHSRRLRHPRPAPRAERPEPSLLGPQPHPFPPLP